MIGTISIKCNAAHPLMALPEVFTYASSPSSIRLIDVPKKIGKWQITSVSVKAVYPDGSQTQASCVLASGVWVCTLAGSSAVGKSEGGITVYASGIDENGESVSGYVLGKGDMTVLADDGEVHPEVQSYVVKFFDEKPEQPECGNMYELSDQVMLYTGEKWLDLGLLSGDYIEQGGDAHVNKLSAREFSTYTDGASEYADINASQIRFFVEGGCAGSWDYEGGYYKDRFENGSETFRFGGCESPDFVARKKDLSAQVGNLSAVYFPLSGVVSGDVRLDKAQIWFGDKHGQYIPECFSMVVSAEEGEYGLMDRLRFTSFGSGGWMAGNVVGDVVLDVEYGKTIAFKEDVYAKNEVYTKAEVDSQISSKADKTKSVKEYYPVLSDSWTGAGYTFRYAGKYMSTDVEQWLPTTYSPEGWSLRFIDEEYGWILAGPMSTQLTGIGIDATTLRFKNSEYDYTFTRNMTNYTEELYNVVYADTVEQMYTKAEVDAIIQKLKEDNNLV